MKDSDALVLAGNTDQVLSIVRQNQIREVGFLLLWLFQLDSFSWAFLRFTALRLLLVSATCAIHHFLAKQDRTCKSTSHEKNMWFSYSLQSALAALAMLLSLRCSPGQPASGHSRRKASSRLHRWSSAQQDIGKVQPLCRRA